MCVVIHCSKCMDGYFHQVPPPTTNVQTFTFINSLPTTCDLIKPHPLPRPRKLCACLDKRKLCSIIWYVAAIVQVSNYFFLTGLCEIFMNTVVFVWTNVTLQLLIVIRTPWKMSVKSTCSMCVEGSNSCHAHPSVTTTMLETQQTLQWDFQSLHYMDWKLS